MKPEPVTSTAIVIPVHNRRETTLKCLRNLAKQGVLDWARAIVVDDGSTDGTSDAVGAEFPQVKIVKGDGNLWWSGGINRGTEAALEMRADHVFWLNDDCFPREGTMNKLLSVSKERDAMATATVQIIETGYFSSGGHMKTPTWMEIVVPEGDSIEPCDAFSGNCVCIPRAVFDKIGIIDQANFPQISDFDFGLRAKKAGFKAVAVGGAFCDGSDPPLKNRRSWLFGDITIREIWAVTFNPIYGWLAPWAWKLRWRHWGFRGLLMNLTTLFNLLKATILRLLVPQSILRKCFGRLSHTHRVHTEYAEWEKTQESVAPSTNA